MGNDIKVYYISNPDHSYDNHFIFSVKNKNSHGLKYYLMNLPSEKKPNIELKKINNSILLLKELNAKPISIETETDEYLKALSLLEYSFKQKQNNALGLLDSELDNGLNAISEISKRANINRVTSNIGDSDIASIISTLKK